MYQRIRKCDIVLILFTTAIHLIKVRKYTRSSSNKHLVVVVYEELSRLENLGTIIFHFYYRITARRFIFHLRRLALPQECSRNSLYTTFFTSIPYIIETEWNWSQASFYVSLVSSFINQINVFLPSEICELNLYRTVHHPELILTGIQTFKINGMIKMYIATHVYHVGVGC